VPVCGLAGSAWLPAGGAPVVHAGVPHTTATVVVVDQAGQEPPVGRGPSVQLSVMVSVSPVDGQVNVEKKLPAPSVVVALAWPVPVVTAQVQLRSALPASTVFPQGADAFAASADVFPGALVLADAGLATAVSHVGQQLVTALT